MQSVEFLQRLFPLSGPDDPRAADVIRFIVVGPNQPWPGIHHFRTKGEIHASNEMGVNALGFQTHGFDVYFTPHGFLEGNTRVTKEDASLLVDVAWVECDDDDIPPETFTPKPSLAVETSPGRFHLYWLLDSPVSSAEIERINYRLTYGNNLKQDKSGWALTKLLRLPGSSSYKRETPFPVQVKEEHLDRIYSLEDFGDLMEAPKVLAETQRAIPTALRTREEIEQEFAFSKELCDLLERPRPDRSSALWRIYSLCYRMGMSQEDCFSLTRKSANDKFTDWRYNGESGLWKDILRGYHMAHTPEDTPVLAKIRAIRQAKMPKPERRRAIADEILKDLCVRGRMYVDEAKRDALYYDGTHVLTVDPKNRQWKNLLALRYCTVDGDEDYTSVNANLYALAMATGEPVTPRIFSYWDTERGLLYIYNNGGRLFRLDGEKIELLENGADGVLFQESDTADLIQPELPGETSPSLETALLALPNYVDDPAIHTRAQAMALARIWMYGLFFAEHMEARPYLVMVGPSDSGKSTLFQMMNVLLLGVDAKVQALSADRPNFENIVSNNHHVFFDNVDDQTGRRWLMDALAEVATGIQFNRRVLYTNNETVTFTVQCSLGFTTRDPWFSRADIATRIIPLNVEPRKHKTNLTTLLDIVRANRGVLWTELLNDLNGIVKGLAHHTAGSHELRMAGYADFLDVVCKVFGISPAPLLNIISGQQKTSALEHSVVWQMLEPWLRETDRNDPEKLKNNNQWITTTRLHTELKRIADKTGDERLYIHKVPSVRALSDHLRENTINLSNVVDVEFEKKHPVSVYKFSLRSAA